MINSFFRQRAFSLIELLVVVLVIVMLTTVVSLNVGTGGRGIKRADEVRQLAATMGYAQSEAELSGTDYGLLLEQTSTLSAPQYTGRWLKRFDQGWARPRMADDVLAPFHFATGSELLLTLIDQPEVTIEASDPELIAPPHIVFFAGGEVTEGSLEWYDQQTAERLFSLRWDLFGRMTVMPNREAPDDERL